MKQKQNHPNQTVFYRHFKNLRRQIQETKLLNTSYLQKSSHPNWDSQSIKNQKKDIANLSDLSSVFQSIGSISSNTLPFIKGFGPALNRLPKYHQRLRQYEISDQESPSGFEKTNRFQSGKFYSTLYFTGQIQPGTTLETMTVNAKGCPTTIIVEGDEQNNEDSPTEENPTASDE